MSTYKKTWLLKTDSWKNLVKKLAKKCCLPEVSSSMGIYFDHDGKNFEIKFTNSECVFKTHNNNSSLDSSVINIFKDNPNIGVENHNIKFFLKALKDLGLSRAFISGKVTNIKFKFQGVEFADLNLNTPIGDLLIARNINLEKFLNNSFITRNLESEDIDRLFKNSMKTEPVFSELNTLNKKITNYADEFGIDLTSSIKSNIEDRMISKSNDFSDFESAYEKVIGSPMNLGTKNYKVLRSFFMPLSVIIPAYNANNTIKAVLESIESQDISNNQKKLLEVIIVDDGSILPVADVLTGLEFSFNLKLIRIEKNGGLSGARNLGVASAKYERILFLDSDILLAKNYLVEHSVALQMYPNALFISMKNNIEPDSEIVKPKEIKKGLPVPKKFNDKRLIRTFQKGDVWIHDVNSDGVYEVLSETDCFKSFGYKRTVGCYDLSSMVVGHNMSTTRRLHNKIGGFSSNFIGWGLEDTYFGSRIISAGGFIIPLLDTGVYHINHPPRSGSAKQQKLEYEKNVTIYKNLICN